MLYPLKFKPILKQTIWGGDKLAYKSNDPKVKESIGESWEISGVQDNISVVSEGALEGNSLQELTEIYMGDLVGDKIYEKFGIEFPLLIKYIDARDNLSIQVHPDDATANSYQLFSMRLSVPLMNIKSKLENGIYKIECCRSGSDD